MRLRFVADVVKLYPGLAHASLEARWIVFHNELKKLYPLNESKWDGVRLYARDVIAGAYLPVTPLSASRMT
jgi:hypothetical protein